jgi:ribosomal protein S18 acetylase RimI-like enzyme
VDDEPGIWSITCFFIAKSERGHGVATILLDAAVAHAASKGARAVEAYPVVVHERRPAADVWRGTLEQFERAGFEVLLRRKSTRPIVRKSVRKSV